METMTAITTRRSVPVTGPEAPSPHQILTLLRAAVRAPTHHLTQPWRFVVLAGDALEQLADVFAEHARQLGKNVAAARALPARSPVIVAVIESPGGDHHVPATDEHYAVGAAMQNLLLAAHDAGLAAMLRTGTYASAPLVRAHLGLDTQEAIAGFVHLGSRPGGKEREPTPRTPAEELTQWRGFDSLATTEPSRAGEGRDVAATT